MLVSDAFSGLFVFYQARFGSSHKTTVLYPDITTGKVVLGKAFQVVVPASANGDFTVAVVYVFFSVPLMPIIQNEIVVAGLPVGIAGVMKCFHVLFGNLKKADKG